mgnify:FL=1
MVTAWRTGFWVVLLLVSAGGYAQSHRGCSHAAFKASTYQNPLYEQWLSDYDVKFLHLDLEASNASTLLSGAATCLVEVVNSTDTLVLELLDSMEVTDVVVDSTDHPSFEHRNNALFIPLGDEAEAGERITLTVDYRGDAGQDRGFFAGYSRARDVTFDRWVTYTLSEPFNARDWFPVKQVLTDKIDSVWVDVTCPDTLMVASNGILQSLEPAGPGKHTFRWRTRYPIAYYLVSIAVANYQDFSFNAPLSEPGDSVWVQNYIYNHESVMDTWEAGIRETADMIELFSNLVMDYPFSAEKYGHAMAPMGGGMEHQTMTTLQGFNFTLVAHELAHQWFGDYVTCGNWQDIWINEGFASYMEYVALQNLRSQEEADSWMAYAMSLALEEPGGSVFVPEEDAGSAFRLFDYALSYKKGATLLHMLRYELNSDSLFFAVMRSYLESYADSVATGADFEKSVEQVSGKEYDFFFNQWYYGKGFPYFSLHWFRQNDTLYISSKQEGSSDETPFFTMHFDLEVVTPAGSETIRLFQDQPEEEYRIYAPETVRDVVFDPEKHLLAKGSVVFKFPDDQPYLLGPNPFRDTFSVQFRFPGSDRQISLLNLEGKMIRRWSAPDNLVEFDLSGLSQGGYILVIEDGNTTYREKIIKTGAE